MLHSCHLCHKRRQIPTQTRTSKSWNGIGSLLKKSRQKKKEQLALLEEQVRVLEIQNAELEAANQELTYKIVAFKNAQEPADFLIDDAIFDFV